MYPDELKYSNEHEWAKIIADNKCIIGITYFAQEQLGDVVYVDLPEVGSKVKQFEIMGSIDSVKTASDLYSPLSGTVTKINESLSEKPELVNEDPYGQGWMIEIELEDIKEIDKLMSAEEYKKAIAN